MSAKHTPGPWTAQNDGRDIISIQHSNNDPGAISMTLAKVTARMTWRSQAEANARLIAAAPDLLDALRNISELYDSDEGCRSLPEYIAARAAIARATGEEK